MGSVMNASVATPMKNNGVALKNYNNEEDVFDNEGTESDEDEDILDDIVTKGCDDQMNEEVMTPNPDDENAVFLGDLDEETSGEENDDILIVDDDDTMQ